MVPTATDAICQFIPPFLRYLREALVGANISPARFQVLQVLSESEPLPMVELARRLAVTRRNVTTLIDGLEKEGLAKRLEHPEDRRSTLIELTDQGRTVFDEAAKLHRIHLEALFENISPAERETVAGALTHLTKVVSSKRA
ncbi:MAG: MarR family transcriptional regulator [Pseudomonadota bacterium]